MNVGRGYVINGGRGHKGGHRAARAAKKPKVYLYFQENTFKMYLNHYLEQYAFNLGVERHTVIVL